MADFQLVHRPAIASEPASFSSDFAMKALPEGTLVQVLGTPGGEDLAGLLGGLAAGADHAVRDAGPGQWLIVGDEAMPHAELREFQRRLDGRAFCVDQSHGRVRIRVSGPAVATVLAKGTAVDFDAFGTGRSAMTLIGHISVHMMRCGPESFELIVLRGFAESLWHDLEAMATEFKTPS